MDKISGRLRTVALDDNDNDVDLPWCCRVALLDNTGAARPTRLRVARRLAKAVAVDRIVVVDPRSTLHEHRPWAIECRDMHVFVTDLDEESGDVELAVPRIEVATDSVSFFCNDNGIRSVARWVR